MYGFGDQILMVASDRISAFDVVLPTPIPDKGRVLTGLSLFWFEHFKDRRPKPPDLGGARTSRSRHRTTPTWPAARCWYSG